MFADLARALAEAEERLRLRASGLGFRKIKITEESQGPSAGMTFNTERSEMHIRDGLQREVAWARRAVGDRHTRAPDDALISMGLAFVCLKRARDALDSEAVGTAIEAFVVAMFAEGAFVAAVNGPFLTEDILRQSMALAGAQARHAETRSIRDQVHQWCEAHFSQYRSMDKAAQAVIDAKLAPISFRTARKYVGEWKKLRSAGKA